jgi:hypothetical protein
VSTTEVPEGVTIHVPGAPVIVAAVIVPSTSSASRNTVVVEFGATNHDVGLAVGGVLAAVVLVDDDDDVDVDELVGTKAGTLIGMSTRQSETRAPWV